MIVKLILIGGTYKYKKGRHAGCSTGVVSERQHNSYSGYDKSNVECHEHGGVMEKARGGCVLQHISPQCIGECMCD